MVIPVTDTQLGWTTAKCLSSAGTHGVRRSRQSIDAERYSGPGRSSDARRWRKENERALTLLRGGPPSARALWSDGPPCGLPICPLRPEPPWGARSRRPERISAMATQRKADG